MFISSIYSEEGIAHLSIGLSEALGYTKLDYSSAKIVAKSICLKVLPMLNEVLRLVLFLRVPDKLLGQSLWFEGDWVDSGLFDLLLVSLRV